MIVKRRDENGVWLEIECDKEMPMIIEEEKDIDEIAAILKNMLKK